jgi:hypothetical protein
MNQQTPHQNCLTIDAHVSSMNDWLSVGLDLVTQLEALLDFEKHQTAKSQYEQISAVVNNLSKQSVPVPDELRKLKLELSHVMSEYEQSILEVDAMRSGLTDLTDLLAEAFPPTGSGRKQTSGRNNRTQRQNSFYKKYMIFLPELMKENGGEMKISKIMASVQKRFSHEFSTEELERNSNNQPKWRGHVSFARYMLVKEGILSKNASPGCWKLE